MAANQPPQLPGGPPEDVSQWFYYAARTLEGHADDIKTLNAEVNELKLKNALLAKEFSIRAGIWGIIGSAIPVLIMVAIAILRWGGE
jgi:hypothetical protein